MSNSSQRGGSPPSAGRPGVPGGSWAEAMISLGTQMLQLPLLPFRLFGQGLQALAQALEGGQRVVEQGRVGRLPSFTGGVAGPAAVAASPGGQETFAGGTARGGAAAERSETLVKEDKDMSCCDQSLSGCELKIVQYTIVSVNPYIRDARRVIIPMSTIATTDDMTGEDFASFVIARNMRLHPDRFRGRNMQYVRVCYFVLCRLTMPCVDYERQQAEALRAIDETLRRTKRLEGRAYEEEEQETDLALREEGEVETLEETSEETSTEPPPSRGRKRSR